jgi:signal transduction histidine kinase
LAFPPGEGALFIPRAFRATLQSTFSENFMNFSFLRIAARGAFLTTVALQACGGDTETATGAARLEQYEQADTRELVALVDEAAERVRADGEAAFDEFRVDGSRWRRGDQYVFVLDPDGDMLVHPDPELEGANQLTLEDVNGKPIIRGLIEAATAVPGRSEGWYHYQWPVPGAILPRWKSSFVRIVTTPSGAPYIVGGGMYNDRMERSFVVDMVTRAVAEIEDDGEAAFARFYDPSGPFIAKDAYVFVVDMNGVELVNPAFRNLEGRDLLDVTDTEGKPLVREMLTVVGNQGSGWVDYMWPKPGESVSTRKSAYVHEARIGDRALLVGSGVYLADAPTMETGPAKLTAEQLMTLVNEAAEVLESQGEEAFPQFREQGSKWFNDDTYFFVWSTDGTRVFHAANQSIEGRDASQERDALGRPYGQMFLDVAASPSGQGWVHYVYPEPGDIFPSWKSTFLKRVTFPSGNTYVLGAGIYNMQMNRTFIEDIVNTAATLVAENGEEAFGQLRDRLGPFVFMDTYVFVDTLDGVNLVNAGQPSLEGTNLLDHEDASGKKPTREFIALAMDQGSGWVEYQWYKPGSNATARKETYVRRVQHGDDVFIVGSGLYTE